MDKEKEDLAGDNMDKGSNYLDDGKRGIIFTNDSYVHGEYLMLKLTPQFQKSWDKTVAGKQYQKDFSKYILKALLYHYEYTFDKSREEVGDDIIIGIACVIETMKDTLFKEQMDLMAFNEGSQ